MIEALSRENEELKKNLSLASSTQNEIKVIVICEVIHFDKNRILM